MGENYQTFMSEQNMPYTAMGYITISYKTVYFHNRMFVCAHTWNSVLNGTVTDV